MKINNLAFNNDNSLLTCGANDGFYIYKLNPIQKHIYTSTNQKINLMKILNRTNISIMVKTEIKTALRPIMTKR